MHRSTWSKAAAALAVAASLACPLAPAAGASPPPASTVGIMVLRRASDSTFASPAQVLAEADALGVDTLRTSQDAGQPLTSQLETLRDAGKALVITMKAHGPTPSSPGELDAFRAAFDQTLDQVTPALAVVENEETVDEFVSGTADQYLAELRAAVPIAHAHGVPVTNGGIPFEVISLVVWNHLRTTQGTAVADRFLGTISDTTSNHLAANFAQLRGTSSTDPDPYSQLSSDSLRGSWKDAERLLAAYGTDPGDVAIDYVNFHWYATDEEGFRSTGSYTDADALRDAVRSLREMTGKDLVNNELGQWGSSSEAPGAFLDVLVAEEHLPFVLWFDGDGTRADALHDFADSSTTSLTLRPAGRVFARWLVDHAASVTGDEGERRRAYLDRAYQDETGRPADPGGRSYWGGEVGSPAGRVRFGQGLVASSTHDGRSVDDAYGLLLHRQPDPSGRAYWTRWLATADPEDLLSHISASDEYYRQSGSTATGVVDAVYHDLLGRPPDPSGRSYWEAQAATSTGRHRMAAVLVRSTERRRDIIAATFERLLGRAPSATEQSQWSAVLGPPSGSVDDLEAALVATDEYRARAGWT